MFILNYKIIVLKVVLVSAIQKCESATSIYIFPSFLPEELWMDVHNIVQEAVVKAIPKKKKWRKAKRLTEEALQIAEKRREPKGKGEKERCTHLHAVPKNSKER